MIACISSIGNYSYALSFLIHRNLGTTFDLDEGAFLQATRELIDGGH